MMPLGPDRRAPKETSTRTTCRRPRNKRNKIGRFAKSSRHASSPDSLDGAIAARIQEENSVAAVFSLLYSLVAYGLSWLHFSMPSGSSATSSCRSRSIPARRRRGGGRYRQVVLLGLFAVQHSVMARPSFKRWWTRIVPPAVERSTYVLAASLALALLFWQWRPIPEPVIWRVRSRRRRQALVGHVLARLGVLLISTFLINHFELFGLRQVYARLRGGAIPAAEFRTPFVLSLCAPPDLSRLPARASGRRRP